MNKKQFLEKLKSETDDNELVAYYDELISDRVEAGENEYEVVANLDLKKVIRTADFQLMKRDLERTIENKRRSGGIVVLLLLLSTPITVPLALAFGIIIFSMIITVAALIFAGIVGGIALVFGAAQLLVTGASIELILLNVGVGLTAVGIVGLVGYYGLRIFMAVYKWIIVVFFGFGRKQQQKKGAKK